jgi:uroporphyrinogen decarboxylase
MRQAGRYLPEYRETRAKAGDFLSLCKNPELACEVTLQPLRRFSLDAAILFSDILTIPDAMSLGLYFAEGEGPCFQKPLQTIKEIENIDLPDIESLSYVMDAVRLIRKNLPQELPLIGFSGSPWTLACYMVQGKSIPGFPLLMKLIDLEPQTAQLLLKKLSEAVSAYLIEQASAGANALMIFDTWGGLLNSETYELFSLQYMREIIKKVKTIHPTTPIILFTKGGGAWLTQMANSGCEALGLDWTCDLGMARTRVGSKVALQGNFEPELLLTDAATIRKEVKRILEAYGSGSGHIFNLGHGITPGVSPDMVSVLVEAVREFSPSFHS